MTRTQIWRRIAEAYGTPRAQRDTWQVEITRTGLCWALGVLTGEYGGLDGLEPTRHGYWWPLGTAGDSSRALFAGFLAAMTQRERNRLEKGL